MKFKVPFTFSNLVVLKKRSERFIKLTQKIAEKTKINSYLENIGLNINAKQYLAICYRSFFINILIFSVIITSILGIMAISNFISIGLLIAFFISGLILFNQINYPRIFSNKKARNIDKNLISVLQDMLVQLNSGVPIFKIMLNISNSNYGEVSVEFGKITREINSGVPQIQAIEKYGKINSSKYFKRILWQISNGMRAGSDMTLVIEEGVRSLNDEQAIQIQSYGGKLNPLVMFYMIIAVVLPSLGITFIILISSLLGLEKNMLQIIFLLIIVMITFIQVMFIGMIKSRRPSLL